MVLQARVNRATFVDMSGETGEGGRVRHAEDISHARIGIKGGEERGVISEAK